MDFDRLARDAIRTFELPKPSNPPLVLYFAGIPCSGKSTLTKKLVNIFNLCLFNEDQLVKYLTPDRTFTDREENLIFGLVEKIFEQLCQQKISCLFDANVFCYEWRERFRKVTIDNKGVPVCIFTVTPDDIRERLKRHNVSLTGNSDGGFVMDVQRLHYEINRLQKPRFGEELLTYDSSKGSSELGRMVAGIKVRLLNGNQ